jgi:hypothetical protein
MLSNALRVAMIRDIPSWRDGGMSAVKLAPRLGEQLGTVAYHMRVAEKHGALVLARTEQVRGAAEHFYRPGPAADFLIGVVEAWSAV